MQTSRIAPRALAISALWILAGCDFGVDEGHFNALDADAEVTAETQFVNEGSLNPYPIIERASGWVVKVFTTDFGGRMDRVQYIPCSEDTPEACQKAIDAYDSQSQSGKAERVYVEQSTGNMRTTSQATPVNGAVQSNAASATTATAGPTNMAPTQNEAQAAPKPLAATFDGKSYLITKPGTFSLASWKVSYEGKTLDCQGNSVAGCVSAIETYEEIQATGIVDSGAVKLNTKADPKKAFVSGGDDDGGR